MPPFPYQGFVSYRRQDNTAFRSVVDRLRGDVTATYEATTGEELELFLDRQSIGWGADWRQKIATSIDSSTLFIPIITMRYFSSEPCVEELLAFHASAKARGLTDLILPIVLMGTEQIRSDHSKPEVRLIESLNYMSIESAYVAGFDSPEWLATVKRVVDGIVRALGSADEQLASSSSATTDRSGSAAPAHTDADPSPDTDAFSFMEATERIDADVTDYVTAFQRFFEVFQDVLGDRQVETMTPGQLNAFLLTLAERTKAPALELEAKGQALVKTVSEADASLRYLVTEMQDIDDDTMSGTLDGIRRTSADQAAQMRDMEGQLESMLQMFKMLALMNSRFRKSVQPATRSVQALRLAMSTMLSWAQL